MFFDDDDDEVIVNKRMSAWRGCRRRGSRKAEAAEGKRWEMTHDAAAADDGTDEDAVVDDDDTVSRGRSRPRSEDESRRSASAVAGRSSDFVCSTCDACNATRTTHASTDSNPFKK